MRNRGSPTKWVFCAAEFLRGPGEMSASHFPRILFFFTYFIFHKYLRCVVFVYFAGLFLISFQLLLALFLPLLNIRK